MLPDFLLRVFPGESEMARRLRSIDWSTNELGSPDAWPPKLQAAIGLCLSSHAPMQIWWGPSLTLLYNDASIRFLDDKHPGALARSGREWSELAATAEQHLETSPTWCRDVKLMLRGLEAFVTCAFTPILSDSGQVLGAFCTLVDSTQSVLAKRRLDTLYAVSVAAATAHSLGDASTSLIDVLVKSEDVAFAAMYLTDGTSVGTGVDHELPEIGQAVKTVLQSESSTDIALAECDAIAMPLHVNQALAGVLICGVRPSCADETHRTFLELLAAQISAALASDTTPVTAEPSAAEPSAGLPTDSFLSVLGHELRNPLSALMTTLQALMLRAPSTEYELMERSVRQLSRVVDNLLDISRIARGKLELNAKRTELAQIVDRAMELSNGLFTERKNQVFVRVPRIGLRMSVDSGRIAQVFANLLANASRYSDPGARIWIEGSRVDERIRIVIKDEGAGIASERLPHIFEAFYQAPELRPRSSGLGLGLAIARSLIELHGGTLEIRSDGPGRGTECIVELPCEARPISQPRLTPPVVRKRLLLVEDNDDAARSLRSGLEQLGYTVAVAHNAPIALNLARTFDPDVALLDIGLPVMDGWELARRLRAQRTNRELHIVAVTAFDQESHRRKSEEAGFAEHLIKPIDLAKLEEVVEGLPDSTKQ